MRVVKFFNQNPVFRYEEFRDFMRKNGTNRDASIRQLLNYYRKQGKIISVKRLLYIVNPEEMFGVQSVDPYLIAAKATKTSILAYHTALEIYNIAYTTFEELTYLTSFAAQDFSFQNQHYRPVSHPLILTKNKKELFAVDRILRQGIDVKITSLERTLVDVLDRPDLSGGWEEIIRSFEFVTNVNWQKIVAYTLLLNKASIVAKVGYFFETCLKHLALESKFFDRLLKHIPKQPCYLEISQKGDGQGVYIKKWQLIVPEYIVERRWEEPNADF